MKQKLVYIKNKKIVSVSLFHFVSPCFITGIDQGFWSFSSCVRDCWSVLSCFITNETDHQWELLLVCFICSILFQSILEFSLYFLTVSSVSVTEKKTFPPKKTLRGFCAVYLFIAGLYSTVGSTSDCRWRDLKFEFPGHKTFVEIDHEIISTFSLSIPLIQEGQLSVTKPAKEKCE